jgi:signal peptidase II
VSRSERFNWKQTFARWVWVPLVIAVILLVDQTSKAWIERTVPLGGFSAPFPALDPYFLLVHWGNTGTAFGLLRGLGGTLAMAALIIIVLVMIFSRQIPFDNWGVRLCLALILGGAIGNQIDRLRVGHVTDFLLFQAPLGNRMAQFPAFNVADSCITVGVILMALLLLRSEGQRAAQQGSQAEG